MAKILRIHPIGISSHLERLSLSDIDKQLSSMQSAGIHWIRQEFDWATIEPIQGALTFSLYDYIVQGAMQRGMQIIGLLAQYNAPAWYRGTAPWNQPPTAQDYASFAQMVVSHYNGQIPLYEVGNEPNGDGFWYPQSDATAYTTMLQATYPVIKAADSNAKVISAGLSTNAPQTFLEAMYTAGAQDYMDYIGYHPYCWPYSPDDTTVGTSFSLLSALYTIMSNNGDGNKQIMATEIGWPTFTNGVSEANQAHYISRVYQKITHENYQYVSIACIYDFLDDGTDPTDAEDSFGLLHTDYTQKPAFASMQAARTDYDANFTEMGA